VLRTADGVLTTVEVFLNAGYGYDIRCEVVGDTGTVALTNPAHVVVGTAGRRSTGYPEDWRPRFADAYRLELQAWIDALVAGSTAPLPGTQDGVTAIAVAEAVIASMSRGGAWTPVRAPGRRIPECGEAAI
jgi:myo-inositol 2-dehydrogenase/D-chiro-inositol 1-dehydrogenase